ncbi:MAG: hypothetical protein OXU26_05980 [Acidobacteriota bacterium]|nr:hypothetical protein [Acidobacteriota bacterium]MDE2963439.1 hypothetical protein [Acidobacteriota bacterium]
MQTRREFLRTSATSLGLASAQGLNPSRAAPAQGSTGSGRRPRLIYNNDGDDSYSPLATTPEGFLAQRMKTLPGTHVDSIYYCGFVTRRHWETSYPMGPENDPIRVTVDFARQHGLECVFSFRMNDIHDAFIPGRLNPFKRRHPQFLLASFPDPDSFQPFLRWNRKEGEHPLRPTREAFGVRSSEWFSWCAVDYAHPEVRQRYLQAIEEACRRYDLDGVELDWCRHPFFFKPGTERQHVPLLTDFVRTLRRRLRDISRQKGKAIQLAMRVADTPELSLNNGVDAASWIEEGLVDLLVAGAGYVPFTTPVETWIELGHAAGIPVYPCLSGSTRAFQDVRAARAAAQRFWSAGADGLYWFNLFVMSGIRGGRGTPEVHDPHQQQIAEETGEAAVLSNLDKLYTVDRTQEAGYIAHICPRAPLPVTFSTASGSQEKRIPIPVGDDLKESAAAGSHPKTELRIGWSTPIRPDQAAFELNGVRLAAGDGVRRTGSDGKAWMDWKLPRGRIHRGTNELTVRVHPNCPAGLTLEEVHLALNYTA